MSSEWCYELNAPPMYKTKEGHFIYYSSFANFAPHALKGQKLLAQGSALGYFGRKPVAL